MRQMGPYMHCGTVAVGVRYHMRVRRRHANAYGEEEEYSYDGSSAVVARPPTWRPTLTLMHLCGATCCCVLGALAHLIHAEAAVQFREAYAAHVHALDTSRWLHAECQKADFAARIGPFSGGACARVAFNHTRSPLWVGLERCCLPEGAEWLLAQARLLLRDLGWVLWPSLAVAVGLLPSCLLPAAASRRLARQLRRPPNPYYDPGGAATYGLEHSA